MNREMPQHGSGDDSIAHLDFDIPKDLQEASPDYNVDSLLEPQPATRVEFDDTCSRLDAMSDIDRPSADPSTGEMADIHMSFFARTKFSNGTTIVGHSLRGSEEYLEAWGGEPTRSIIVDTADGSVYEYSEYSAQSEKPEKLFVRKPGERIEREAGSGDGISAELSTGMSVGITGTPDLMNHMAKGLAERREADRLGLSKVTDGSLRELSSVIEAALASGVTPRDLK
jgi:hypothetical protein